MTTESTCATTGGSVPGLTTTALCPVCGFPDLPGIEPETLQMLAGCEAVAGFPLADGRLPVHAGGQVYLMPEAGWRRYRDLCASAEATAAAMSRRAAA